MKMGLTLVIAQGNMKTGRASNFCLYMARWTLGFCCTRCSLNTLVTGINIFTYYTTNYLLSIIIHKFLFLFNYCKSCTSIIKSPRTKSQGGFLALLLSVRACVHPSVRPCEINRLITRRLLELLICKLNMSCLRKKVPFK